MKTVLLLACLLALQTATGRNGGPQADPAHLRYERALRLPAGVAGNACAVLDTDVFAHASARSGQDLRIFDSHGAETPFDLTESSSAAASTEGAVVENLGIAGDEVVFDLRMPSRAYSEVDLTLDRKDFLASATVTANNATGATVKLGTFTLFDLSTQHLGRSTLLGLAETTLPVLHVALRFATPEGKPVEAGSLDARALVRGATVPPSREAQTLYTTVVSTTALTEQGRTTRATLDVPAQVPVERATVVLDPAYSGNFVRQVMVDAHDGEANSPDHIEGEILRANLKPEGLPMAPPIHVEQLSVDAVLAANLHEAADVVVTIHNGDDRALPVRAIALSMRERKICFPAAEREQYTLRYGDGALLAPQYDFARLFDPSALAAEAALGAETNNPHWSARADGRPFTERHPELIWIALFGVVAVLGATALASVRREQNKP